jgi:hypothetical protein
MFIASEDCYCPYFFSPIDVIRKPIINITESDSRFLSEEDSSINDEQRAYLLTACFFLFDC